MPTETFKYSTEMLLWKKHKIRECIMEFSCGGDSMNETDFTLYDNKGKAVVCSELTDYFENEVYRKVNFYEASDGHYMGEFGTVTITLEEGEDVEPEWVYDKQASAEFEESYTEEFEVELTKEETEFVKEKVLSMNGSDWGGDSNINYKIDCIITDEEEELVEKLLDKIDNECRDYSFTNVEGEECEESTTWTTDENSEEPELNDNLLTISITRRFLQTQPSED